MTPRSTYKSAKRASTAWPERLIELAPVVREASDPTAAGAALAEIWMLVNSVLRQSLRSQSRRLGPVSAEDIEDLAATKSLELLQRIDGKRWSPATSSPAEVVMFLSTVARNALIDHLRQSSRRARLPVDILEHEARPDGAVCAFAAPDEGADRQHFVDAIRDCADGLEPRDRAIWLFRVIYDLPTKCIADHPEVCVNAGHVDVILQRCRRTIGDCMRSKGLPPSEIPAGAGAAMWEAFRFDDLPVPNGESDS